MTLSPVLPPHGQCGSSDTHNCNINTVCNRGCCLCGGCPPILIDEPRTHDYLEDQRDCYCRHGHTKIDTINAFFTNCIGLLCLFNSIQNRHVLTFNLSALISITTVWYSQGSWSWGSVAKATVPHGGAFRWRSRYNNDPIHWEFFCTAYIAINFVSIKSRSPIYVVYISGELRNMKRWLHSFNLQTFTVMMCCLKYPLLLFWHMLPHCTCYICDIVYALPVANIVNCAGAMASSICIASTSTLKEINSKVVAPMTLNGGDRLELNVLIILLPLTK